MIYFLDGSQKFIVKFEHAKGPLRSLLALPMFRYTLRMLNHCCSFHHASNVLWEILCLKILKRLKFAGWIKNNQTLVHILFLQLRKNINFNCSVLFEALLLKCVMSLIPTIFIGRRFILCGIRWEWINADPTFDLTLNLTLRRSLTHSSLFWRWFVFRMGFKKQASWCHMSPSKDWSN